MIWSDLADFIAASTLLTHCGLFFLSCGRKVGDNATPHSGKDVFLLWPWVLPRNSAFSEREPEGRGVPAGMTAFV